MKKWVFLMLVVLIGYLMYQWPNIAEQGGDSAKDRYEGTNASRGTLHIDKDQIHEGNLILVNKNYAVQEAGISPDILELSQHKELVRGYELLGPSIQLSQRVTEHFIELAEAAREEGISHFRISSGYRDQAEQSKLYDQKGADYALPAGYSEHNTGLSLDIGSTLGEIDEAPEGDWLKKNAWNYGFILRYPKDKTAITGIQYEAWHFRYVGLPHSLIMKEKKLVLEEYLDDLKQQKVTQATVDGKSYEIFYVDAAHMNSIQVPAGHPYEISGDNIGGMIVTVHLSEEGNL